MADVGGGATGCVVPAGVGLAGAVDEAVTDDCTGDDSADVPEAVGDDDAAEPADSGPAAPHPAISRTTAAVANGRPHRTNN